MLSLLEALKLECASHGLRYVGHRGSTSSPICVCGEAPGAEEDQSGFPFVGPSGREQDRMLSEAGISPTDCWFTNPYKVRPPDNDLSRLGELGIPLQSFENAFIEELNAYKPTIVLACGATPLRVLCPQAAIRKGKQTSFPIMKWRGSLLTSPYLRYPHYVIPQLHPAAVLREWSERQVSVMLYEKACEEWNFVHKHGALQPMPKREIIAGPEPNLLIDLLTEARDANPGEPRSEDIETLWDRKSGQKLIYSDGFGLSPWRAFSFCLWDVPLAARPKVFKLIQEIHRKRRIIGQNYLAFDAHFLATVGLAPLPQNVEDTLVRHHVLWIELPHKLEFQTMQYTREPYYKDEGKQWYLGEGKMNLLRYECKDLLVTYEIFLAQEKELE